MRKWFFAMLVALLTFVPVLAQEQDDSVYVRAAHFSADAPEVDVYINGELVIEAFDFPTVSDFVELSAGTYTVDIVVSGGAIEDAVLSGEYDLSAGDWATIAVVGEAARETLAIQPVIEDLGNIPEGLTYVSAFHAVFDFDPVNVFVGDVELVRLLSYPGSFDGADGHAGDAITPGEYDFDVQDADGNSIVSLDTTTLGAGRAYFVAVVGTPTNPSLVLVPTDVEAISGDMVDPIDDVETGEGSLFARIGHFSVDAPQVDVYLNGELVLAEVEFGDVSDYIEVSAGIYDVALVPTGEALDNAAYEGEIALVADSVTLVAAIGFIEDESLRVVTAPEDNEAPATGLSRIAYFQAIPSIELFNLSASDNILMQGVSYPDAFAGAGDGYVSVDIEAASYEFVVEGAGNTLNVGNVTTGAGRVYLIVSVGTETSPIFFLISGEFPVSE